MAPIIWVGTCCRGELRESLEESWLLDATLSLLELSEEPTPLLCEDDGWGTDDDAVDSVRDTEILLLGEAHWTPVCLLSMGVSVLDDVGLLDTAALPATTAAFGGLVELKYLPPPDRDEK